MAQISELQESNQNQSATPALHFDYFENENQMREFFNKKKYENYYYVSYSEYLDIFGININPEQLAQLNKQHVKTHLDYFNYCYNKSFEYRWYPVFFTFFLNSNQKSRYEQSQKYIDILNQNLNSNPETYQKISKKNSIVFGINQEKELDQQFKLFSGEQDDSEQQEQYEFKQNNFTKTVSKFVNKFWYQYIDNPKSSQNIKESLNYIFSAENAQNIRENFRQFKNDFLLYKQEYYFFPNRNDYQILTNYKEINEKKVYTMKQMMKEQAESSIETFNYLFYGQTRKYSLPNSMFSYGEFDKQVEPKYIGLDRISKHLNNSKVLMRVDFNCPLKDNAVKDDTRIVGALPSIKKILSENPKSLVLMSHLGRPNGQRSEKFSMKPIVPKLTELLGGTKVHFLQDCVGEEVQQIVNQSTNGEIILLENLRFHPEEEGKIKNAQGEKVKVDKKLIKDFRAELTSLGNLYVNDAFGTAHRDHSSMTGIDHKIRAAGYLLEKELTYFGQALEKPTRPFLVILGGAKVKDKIQLINNLLDKVDEMIIGGGMAFTFLKRIHGIDIGNSLFDEEGYKIVDQIMEKAKRNNVKIHLPVDFICGDKLDSTANVQLADLSTGIPAGFLGLDAGPQTTRENIEAINRAHTLVWNGPQGVFEVDKFKQGSYDLVNRITERTQRENLMSIIGGGDTVNLIKSIPNAGNQVSHVSTGGGASLELLEGKNLPGVAFLSNIDEI